MGAMILISLALISINMVILLVAGWILAYAGIFFLGFGGARGTPEEQAALCAKLEEMEAKGRVLMEKLCPIVNEIFAHLPQEERQRVLDSPEHLRLAVCTLSEQNIKLDPAILERWERYKELAEELMPLEQEIQVE